MASVVRTIKEFKANLTLTREERDGKVSLIAYENGHKIVHSRGVTDKEAAEWLVWHAYRLMREVARMLLEEKFLTEEEIDAAMLRTAANDG